MHNFSPFLFTRLGRDALDLHYGSSELVADFGRDLYRTPATRRSSRDDAVIVDRSTTATAFDKGVMRTFAINSPVISTTSAGYALRIEPQGTNKAGLASAPTSLAGVSRSGSSGVLSLVDDTAELAAAGLAGITGGKCYKLDNTAGAGPSRISISNTFDNRVPHAMSAYARGEGVIKIRTGFRGYEPLGALTPGYDRRWTSTAAATSGSASEADIMWIEVSAGGMLYVALPQIETGSTPTSYIPSASETTVTRAADVVTSASPSSSGPVHLKVDFTVYVAQPADSYNRIIELYSASSRCFLQIFGPTGELRMLTQDDQRVNISADLGAVTPGISQSAAIVFDGASSKGVISGGAVTPMAGAEISGLTTVALGSARSGIAHIAGGLLISSVSIGSGSLTNAEMIAMVGG